MPVPTNPTADELVAEALEKAGESSPESSLSDRAKNSWLEEIKNDIWKRSKRLTLLHTTSHGMIVSGQSRYSYPSDYSSDLELTLLDGSLTGTAQGGSSSTITLSSSDASSSTNLIGKEIIITSGTGVGSLSQVVSYNTATKVAGVAPNFKTSPGAGSGYMFIDQEHPVAQKPIGQFSIFHRMGTGTPVYFFPIGDEDYGEFILDVAPDKAYGARLRYYANIMKMDTDGTLISTAYLQWRAVFIEGIVYKRWQDVDDSRVEAQWARYQRELNTLIMRETYGTDLNNLTDRVADYY
jgi:hypothetical protein